jgi:RecQ-mediated genome instability protein 1
MPKYLWVMLKFELSDGATTLQAIKYRPLPKLTLGVTPLGYNIGHFMHRVPVSF